MATATIKELNKVGFPPAQAKILAASLAAHNLKTLTRGAHFSVQEARALKAGARTLKSLIKEGKFTKAQATLILKV